MFDLNINEFLINKENADAEIESRINYVNDLLFEIESNIRKQFLLTMKSNDKIDHIRELISDEVLAGLANDGLIDEDAFTKALEDFIYACFKTYINIDDYYLRNLSADYSEKIWWYYLYYFTILSQDALCNLIYSRFYELNSKQIAEIENVIGRKIEKFHNKALSKKFNLKSTNYVLDLNNIFKTRDDLINVILKTNIFIKNTENVAESSLFKNLLEEDEFELFDYNFDTNDYKVDIFKEFKYFSKDVLAEFVSHIVRDDECLGNLVNMVEVLAITNKFENNFYKVSRRDDRDINSNYDNLASDLDHRQLNA